jgi:phage-related protein
VSELGGIPPYRIAFFALEDGTEPVRRWLHDLPPPVTSYVGYMLKEHLQRRGPDVVTTRFGKNLGGGLYEFRLGDEVEVYQVLYRIFFHIYGDRIVLLLHAYDKGQRPSLTHQNEMIDVAPAPP